MHPQQRVREEFAMDLDGTASRSHPPRLDDTPQVTVLFYAIQSFVITIASGDSDDGLLDGILYFLQISNFAVASPVQAHNSAGDTSSSLSRIAAFASVLSSVSESCLSPGMNARDVQALLLVGPLLIISFGMCWSWLLQTRSLRSILIKRGVHVPRISHSGAFATLGLQVFVSITTVLCQLVQCTRVGSDDVLFIQGTEPCHTPLRSFLIFAIAVLFSLPFAVAVLLWKNRLPKAARASLCCAFTPSAYLWNTALLAYRLIMGTVFVFNEVPSTRAIILHLITSVVTLSLVFFRPYINSGTQFFNVFAFVCLESQFALSILAQAPETFGFDSDALNAINIINDLALAVTILRYMPVAVGVAMLIGRIPAVLRCCSRFSFGNVLQCLQWRLVPLQAISDDTLTSASGSMELKPIIVFPPAVESSQHQSGYLIASRPDSDGA